MKSAMAEQNWPKISIITPCLNQAQFLSLAIESVITQEYPNLEYIIIDGGSTDGSLDIIKKYEKYLSYWHSGQDNGQSEAINKGFEKANGEIVAWLNSDDLYLPGAFHKAAKSFLYDPQLDLLYGNCVFIDQQGQFVRYFTECEPYNAKRLRNCSDFIMQPTTFFKRRTLMRVGFLNTTLHYTMDWDLWSRFAKAGAKVRYVSQVLAANRQYDETKTNSGGLKRMAEILNTNMRNMTGIWPNAFFSYAAYELKTKCKTSSHFFNYLVGVIAQVISEMSLNRFLGPEPQHLYGLHPHSKECTENPEFIIPHYDKEKPKFLKLHFDLENQKGEVDIQVIINGKECFRDSNLFKDKGKIIIPIESEVRATNCYKVVPKFWIDRLPVPVTIHQIELLYND